MVTSMYDGPIAARQNPSGGIQSEEAFYVISMNVISEEKFSDQKILAMLKLPSNRFRFQRNFIKQCILY